MKNIISILFLIYYIDLNDGFFQDRNCLKRYCFEEIGCFSAQSYIDEVKQALSPKNLVQTIRTTAALKHLLAVCPISPDQMNMTFYMFTKSSRQSQLFKYNPTADQLKKSSFSSQKRTAVVVHGYTDSYKENDWMATMKNYFLDRDYNVIAVDWSKPAKDVNYFNSAFNSQIAGSMVALFIKRLVDVFRVKPQSFHLVGHSLGAHVCGFAGKRFNSTDKIGHISGLDPAGPGFEFNKLSREDAQLVVVSHTSAGILKDVDENIGEHPIESIQLSGFLGCTEPLGHFDFWPNGGSGQPGCEKLTKEFIRKIISEGASGVIERGGCSHNRAVYLPTARPQNKCQIIGYKCKSYEAFNDGECADCGENDQDCKPFEFDIDYWINPNNWKQSLKTFPNDYYVKTSEKDPFCLFHYQITIEVEESSEAGEIKIILIGDKQIEVTFKKSLIGFKADQNYTQLVTDSDHWGKVREVVMDFDNNLFGKIRKFKKKLNPFRMAKNYPIKIKRVFVKFMSNKDPRIRQSFSSILVPDYESGDSNESGDSVTFRLK